MSMFVHVTVEPRANVKLFGRNPMFCITTDAADGVAVPGVGVWLGPAVGVDVGVGMAVTAHGVAALARF